MAELAVETMRLLSLASENAFSPCVDGLPDCPHGYIALHLRRTRHSDVAAVLALIEKVDTDNVLRRPPEQHHEAIDSGLHFAIWLGDQLVGTGAVFIENDLAELGGTAVDRDVKGFGLQRVLLRVRLVAVEVARAARGCTPYTAVSEKNNDSRKNVLRVGGEPWSAPSASAFVPCANCSKRTEIAARGERCCNQYYIFPPRSRGAAALKLAEPGPLHRVHREGGRPVLLVHVDVDFLAPEPLALLREELACALSPSER